MGAKQSAYRRAVLRHEQKLKYAGCLYTDDVLSGDMVLICENVSTGLQTNTSGRFGTHSVMNPAILKGIQRSQLGKPVHLPQKDISGFNTAGVIVCDRLGDKFVLEATAMGIESMRLDDRVKVVQESGGIIAIRQVDTSAGRQFGRSLLRIFEAAKNKPLTWERAIKVDLDRVAGKTIDVQLETTSEICLDVMDRVRNADRDLSIETKAELDQLFTLYDKDGDGTVDEEELETMISEMAGKTLSIEKRLKILTRLDADADGGISLVEFYDAMRQLPGITSIQDTNVTSSLAAHFVLQVYNNIGLLAGYPEFLNVNANMLKFDADIDFEFQESDFYPEVPLCIRPENQVRKGKKTSRLAKIPRSAFQRRERKRKARIKKREMQEQARAKLLAQEAERKQKLAEQESQIMQQIEQARMLKERERELQNQLKQEEDEREREREGKKSEASANHVTGEEFSVPGALNKYSTEQVLNSFESEIEGDFDREEDEEAVEYEREMSTKDFNAILQHTLQSDRSLVQYYYIDFVSRHTGLTVRRVLGNDGRPLWVVVDIRSGSQAEEDGVDVGHTVVSIGDYDLDEDENLTDAEINEMLLTGSRPLTISLAATEEEMAKHNDNNVKSSTILAEGEFEVEFKSKDMGFDVEKIDEAGDVFLNVKSVVEGGEADKLNVQQDFYVAAVSGVRLEGDNCSLKVMGQLIKEAERPVSIAFGM